jgi:hypothetical protein
MRVPILICNMTHAFIVLFRKNPPLYQVQDNLYIFGSFVRIKSVHIIERLKNIYRSLCQILNNHLQAGRT